MNETVSHEQYSQVGYQYEPKVENDAKNNNDDQNDTFKVPVGLIITANLILVCNVAYNCQLK